MAVTEEFRVVTVNIGEKLALVAAVSNLAWPVGVPRNGPTLADLPVRKLVVKVGCESAPAPDLFVENGS